jgi:hypothetical protein
MIAFAGAIRVICLDSWNCTFAAVFERTQPAAF